MIYSHDADGVARLQSYVDGFTQEFEPVYLTPGEYHIHGGDNYVNLHLRSLHLYGVRIFVHEVPLLPHHNSEIKGITFEQSAPDVPLMRLDHSSRAVIHGNVFRARTQGKGVALLASEQSVSEDNWKVSIYNNLFEGFEVGIETKLPSPSPIPPHRVKGTMRWSIHHNDFDYCAYALRLLRAEIFEIAFNHIQLHYRGISLLASHSNYLIGNDFERGERNDGAWDIYYDEDTCHNLAIGNTANGDPRKRPPTISPFVQSVRLHNQYARQIRKLNIWADCDKGE